MSAKILLYTVTNVIRAVIYASKGAGGKRQGNRKFGS